MAGAALVADAALLKIADGLSAESDGADNVAFRFSSTDTDDHLRFLLDRLLRLNRSMGMIPHWPAVVNLHFKMESRLQSRAVVNRLTFLLLACILFGSAASAELRLEVDVQNRELHAFLNGDLHETFIIAVGKKTNPTPQGTFTIRKVIWNPSWAPPDAGWARGKTAKPPGHPDNPMKKVKMFFNEPDYYIHGTGDEDSLGSASSHGCVRMSPEDVTRLARLVMEHGGKPMPAPWYRRMFQRRASRVVHLDKPVPIEIR